jgi:hypothetical protein
MSELSRLIDDVLGRGIDDKAVWDKLVRFRSPREDEYGTRVCTRLLGTGDDRHFETLEAGVILGKYWYRHQDPSYFEEVQYHRDETFRTLEAYKHGELAAFKPMPPEPAASPRRRSPGAK